MTRRRDLGPALALTGAGIAAIAVVAGFVTVGGPGDSRDRRLDEMTVQRISEMMSIIQCAFNRSATAPASFADAMASTGWIDKDRNGIACILGADAGVFAAADTDKPANPGSVTYKALDRDSVRICANFRRPHAGEDCQGVCYGVTEYTEWLEPRPSGVVCRDSTLELVHVERPMR